MLECGHVKADVEHSPTGFYTAKAKDDCSSYNLGCIIEVSNGGRVLSKQESNSLRELMVPEGFIAVKDRSVKEYILHPLSTQVVAIVFHVEQLMAAIGFEAELPPPAEKRFRAAAKTSSDAAKTSSDAEASSSSWQDWQGWSWQDWQGWSEQPGRGWSSSEQWHGPGDSQGHA